MDTLTFEEELKSMKICRFCLTQDTYILKSIYTRDEKIKSTAPMPIQIMAIASIEASEDDGMPIYVCNDCRIHFEYCYRFKQMCKQADTQLRQYPFRKELPEPLVKPKLPIIQQISPPHILNSSQKMHTVPEDIIIGNPLETIDDSSDSPLLTTNSNDGLSYNVVTSPVILQGMKNLPSSITVTKSNGPKRLHNANPSQTPEPPVPKRIKLEKTETKPKLSASALTTSKILDKVDNNEMSFDDVKLLIEAAENDEILFLEDHNLNPNSMDDSQDSEQNVKPKLLNKVTKRILNKEVANDYEPKISAPQIKRNEDGNVEVVTEILDPNEPYDIEPDPLKSAAPIQTNVFPCPKCIRTFPLKQLLDIHMEKHNRDRPHPCTECGKSFFTKYDLQKHIVIHTGEKPFKCSVCDKAYNRAALLHHHEKTHPDVAKFICIYCEKPFLSKEELQKHMQRHLKHRPFECKYCNKAFAFKQGLERHEAIHSKVHPHHCEYCEMSFTTPGKLARHLTAHAGKRAYPCKYCGKSFILSHHLTRHLRSHKEFISDYICTACKAVHKTREEFLAHCTTHAMQSLICPLCKDNLKNRSEVDRHMQEHERDGFACEYCDLMFTENSKLSRHLQFEHADEMKNLYPGKGTKASAASTSSGFKKKPTLVKASQQQAHKSSLSQFEEHLLDEVLVDEDESDPDNVDREEEEDEEFTSALTETIKIEPLSIEDEQERATLEKQNEKSQERRSSIDTKPKVTKQTILNLSPNNSSMKIVKQPINKQTFIESDGPSTSNAKTAGRQFASKNGANNAAASAKTSRNTSPRQAPSSPSLRKSIQEQQQQQQQQIQKQQQVRVVQRNISNSNSNKNLASTSKASSSDASPPGRVMRVVKNSPGSTTGSISSNKSQTSSSGKVLLNNRLPTGSSTNSVSVKISNSGSPTPSPTPSASTSNTTSSNSKVKRLTLTKQEINDLVKKGHKIVRVPKEN